MTEYYTQRASEGGFIISEANAVAADGRAYWGAPGLYSDEQVLGWKDIVSAVHAKGSKIFAQLWHGGRVGHGDFTGGIARGGPSDIPFTGHILTQNGFAIASPLSCTED